MTTTPFDVLLSFVGSKDPFANAHGRETKGPLLMLCEQRQFQRIVLFYTEDEAASERARRTTEHLSREQPADTKIEMVRLAIKDPTNHGQVLEALRSWWQKQPLDDLCEYYISISSGTPAMHACWLLLAAADEIHANLLYVRAPRYVDSDQPLVGEINPRAPEFPSILPRASLMDLPTLANPAKEKPADSPDQELRGESPAFIDALKITARYASSDHNVLLLGETGTGKERFAQYIHAISKRADGPFLAINCAAFPATLIESELFGHIKGSFSGADADKKGAFEEANGGTLFLDEVGDMPLEMQTKLLRALQERKIRPIGGKERPVDVRLISATHCDLPQYIKQGRFRDDLYQRLHVLPLSLPALRDRSEDIVPLSEFFLQRENLAQGTQIVFAPETLTSLLAYSWPGNIRELENTIIRACVLAENNVITPDQIPTSVLDQDKDFTLPVMAPGFSIKNFLDEYRDRLYAEALRFSNNNLSAAGRLLDVSPEAVRKAQERLKGELS